MVIVGANLGKTSSGMKLNDGGCCIIADNRIYAIAEERVSRKKYDGGFEYALDYCLDAADICKNDVDLMILSSCCEPVRTKSDTICEIPANKIQFCPSHHLSHAYSVFMTSPFQKALILVIDNEGNVLKEQEHVPFHKCQMEHMSYYIGSEDGIRLLERDEIPLDEIGVGDAYRYFTHYLGFPSYEYAGKTMGLASYGNPDAYKGIRIFSMKNGHIRCRIRNQYENCNQAVFDFLSQNCCSPLPPRFPLDLLTQQHADLAYLIQSETERILIEKINELVRKTGIRDICISGGVGLNSVANGKIQKECNIDRLYVIPGAGDSGQCLGNALYGYCQNFGFKEHFSLSNAYLGKQYSDDEIAQAVRLHITNHPKDKVMFFDEQNSWARAVATQISIGKYVGHFNGRSEFGPRALGNRSIFCDPRDEHTKDVLNRDIKHREVFRPFAPVIMQEHTQEWFDISSDSPYMLLVAKVLQPNRIPAVTHIDGTARLQTVTSSQNEILYSILQAYEELTGVPILLNTSFNVAGEPMVETPEDAIRCFQSTNLDCLAIGRYLLIKDSNTSKQIISEYERFVISLGEDLISSKSTQKK